MIKLITANEEPFRNEIDFSTGVQNHFYRLVPHQIDREKSGLRVAEIDIGIIVKKFPYNIPCPFSNLSA